MDRVQVKNAADPKQVKAAGQLERRKAETLHNALRTVLSTYEGRLVLWEIIGRAGTREGIFDHSGSVTYFKAGRQNFGFELLGLFERRVQASGPPPDVERLLAERVAARERRDFRRSDELRAAIAAHGWAVEDTAAGPRLTRKDG